MASHRITADRLKKSWTRRLKTCKFAKLLTSVLRALIKKFMCRIGRNAYRKIDISGSRNYRAMNEVYLFVNKNSERRVYELPQACECFSCNGDD